MPEKFTEEKDIFHRHIQRAGLKRTAQRDLILEVFLRTEEHLSSEDLYNLIKQEDPTVGHTTVYRTLKLLVEAGLAREVRFGDGACATSTIQAPAPRPPDLQRVRQDHRVLSRRTRSNPDAILAKHSSCPSKLHAHLLRLRAVHHHGAADRGTRVGRRAARPFATPRATSEGRESSS